MNTLKPFLNAMSVVAIAVVVIILLMDDNEGYQEMRGFVWLSFLFFFVITVISYLINVSTLQGPVKSRFTMVFFATTIMKFLTSLLLLIVYKIVYAPYGYGFLVPFFAFFVVFKAIEVYFLLKVSQRSGY